MKQRQNCFHDYPDLEKFKNLKLGYLKMSVLCSKPFFLVAIETYCYQRKFAFFCFFFLKKKKKVGESKASKLVLLFIFPSDLS
jgi:hypothetical protein